MGWRRLKRSGGGRGHFTVCLWRCRVNREGVMGGGGGDSGGGQGGKGKKEA